MSALTDLKAHLNIVDNNDDELLTSKIAAAELFTSNHIGADEPLIYSDATADLRQAILMLAAHWYENREATLVGLGALELPFGYRELVQPHRAWVF